MVIPEEAEYASGLISGGRCRFLAGEALRSGAQVAAIRGQGAAWGPTHELSKKLSFDPGRGDADVAGRR